MKSYSILGGTNNLRLGGSKIIISSSRFKVNHVQLIKK